MSENPAHVFRLPNKGRMTVGSDADFTIVDMKRAWRFKAATALTKSRANMRLWDGFKMKGAVITTMVRGVPVYQDGQSSAPRATAVSSGQTWKSMPGARLPARCGARGRTSIRPGRQLRYRCQLLT